MEGISNKTARYCLMSEFEDHICHKCGSCYCKFIEEHGQEPTDDEIEAEMERQMAEAEAMADNL